MVFPTRRGRIRLVTLKATWDRARPTFVSQGEPPQLRKARVIFKTNGLADLHANERHVALFEEPGLTLAGLFGLSVDFLNEHIYGAFFDDGVAVKYGLIPRREYRLQRG